MIAESCSHLFPGHRSLVALASFAVALASAPAAADLANCQFRSAGGDIEHVIYVQFDNTHFLRDNPERALGPRADAASARFHPRPTGRCSPTTTRC